MTRNVLATAACLLATGCPGSDATNPPILWLAPDSSEVIVKLSSIEPAPW